MSSPDPAAPLDPLTLRAGLLLDAVETQRREAGELLAELRGQLQGLPGLLSSQVRAGLAHEPPGWRTVVRRALPGALVAAVAGAAPLAVAGLLLPSPAGIEALRARRAELSAAIATLEREGGRTQLRRCGASARLCVRIEAGAPAYGAGGEFRVVKGY
ncbi:MAG: hypothetical protein JSS29_13960 [Proteobacteria bacterium]|nr:hypothetical protein [Pseudomonadota bacterium]